MSTYYFYMWRHPYTGMTCYGITSNEQKRRTEYEGHNGFEVQWEYLISGEEPIIRELEKNLKSYIKKLDLGFKGYEWIDKTVEYVTIVNTVEYLLDGKNVSNMLEKKDINETDRKLRTA